MGFGMQNYEESNKLCSFVAPHGLYRFRKMPFGLQCDPEIFQYMTERVFKGTGAIVSFDDVLIPGRQVPGQGSP